MTEPDPRTCASGQRCALRTEITDQDGRRTRWVPAPVEGDQPALCTACTRNLGRALRELPDLYAKLDLEHLPDLAVRYRQVMISTSKLHPPIPLDGHIDALARLLEFEVGYWAEQVAVDTGLVTSGEWGFHWTALSRPGHRVQTAAVLLDHQLDPWLDLDARTYPARSLTTDPAHGHDSAELVEVGPLLCVVRTGAEAGARVLQLVRGAREAIGAIARQLRSPLPCRRPECRSRQVYQQHASLDWVCRTCGDTRSSRSHTDALRAEVQAIHDKEALNAAQSRPEQPSEEPAPTASAA